MAYNNFIFDIDGTLVDCEKASMVSLGKAIYEVLGIRLPDADLYKHYGVPGADFYKMFNLTKTEEIDKLWGKYFDQFKQNLFPGVLDVIKYLYDNNYILAIVTSRNKEEMKNLVKLDILKYFKVVIDANDTEKHKPDKEPIETVINRLSLDKSETIYIGDTDYDSMSAHSAGIDFGLALWGTRFPDILAEIKFSEPKQILEVLKTK